MRLTNPVVPTESTLKLTERVLSPPCPTTTVFCPVVQLVTRVQAGVSVNVIGPAVLALVFLMLYVVLLDDVSVSSVFEAGAAVMSTLYAAVAVSEDTLSAENAGAGVREAALNVSAPPVPTGLTLKMTVRQEPTKPSASVTVCAGQLQLATTEQTVVRSNVTAEPSVLVLMLSTRNVVVSSVALGLRVSKGCDIWIATMYCGVAV